MYDDLPTFFNKLCQLTFTERNYEICAFMSIFFFFVFISFRPAAHERAVAEVSQTESLRVSISFWTIMVGGNCNQ